MLIIASGWFNFSTLGKNRTSLERIDLSVLHITPNLILGAISSTPNEIPSPSRLSRRRMIASSSFFSFIVSIPIKSAACSKDLFSCETLNLNPDALESF